MSAEDTALRPFHRRLRGARTLRDGTVLYWWVELVCAVVFYIVYSAIRNANGNDPAVARDNAIKLIGWQKTLGINYERTLQ